MAVLLIAILSAVSTNTQIHSLMIIYWFLYHSTSSFAVRQYFHTSLQIETVSFFSHTWHAHVAVTNAHADLLLYDDSSQVNLGAALYTGVGIAALNICASIFGIVGAIMVNGKEWMLPIKETYQHYGCRKNGTWSGSSNMCTGWWQFW